MLREEISSLLDSDKVAYENGSENDSHRPHVVMVVGVNGVGKTTTIGKLAHQFKAQGKQVMLGCRRHLSGPAPLINCKFGQIECRGPSNVRQEMGSDPASVAFDTLTSCNCQ